MSFNRVSTNLRFSVRPNTSGGFIVVDWNRRGAMAYYHPDETEAQMRADALNADSRFPQDSSAMPAKEATDGE